MEENFQVASASVTDRGLSEKRPQNEDSYLELSKHGIFAVADGVGGAQAGDVASQMAVEIIGEAFANKPESADAEDVMRVAIQRANSAIYQMSHDLPQLATMATTVVALHLSGNIATVGHVGDSRIYRVDSSGNITQETLDHSVVAEEVRAGRMTPEQAAVHPSRNVISRALGAEATVEVDMKTIMVEPNTSFMLCSDGITRHIDDWELESVFRAEQDLEDICRRLKQICYDRGAEDNLTAVVVKIKGDEQVFEESAPIFIEDPEEDTVATVRSPFDQVAEPVITREPEQLISLAPIPAHIQPEPNADNGNVLELVPDAPPAVMPEVGPEPIELDPLSEPEIAEPAVVEPLPIQEIVETSPTQVFAEPVPIAPTPKVFAEPPRRIESVVEPKRRGFLGGFLSSFLLLVLGGLLGAAGMYFLFQPQTVEQQPQAQPQASPALLPKSDNPPLTAYEEARRNVDKDPKKFLEANKEWSPSTDAADL
ncbi:MAG TPA: protein phosphatase 2C domain-containing protein, partial [Pyrinomonadaceae bacterium]|nr:protein phosphatase 2C domain-containing protein [Pyrinomonadaceae bacterium]